MVLGVGGGAEETRVNGENEEREFERDKTRSSPPLPSSLFLPSRARPLKL